MLLHLYFLFVGTIGAAIVLGAQAWRLERRWRRTRVAAPRPLPAATARQIARDRRANRPDLRLVMRPLHSIDPREVEPAHRKLGEPPSFYLDKERAKP